MTYWRTFYAQLLGHQQLASLEAAEAGQLSVMLLSFDLKQWQVCCHACTKQESITVCLQLLSLYGSTAQVLDKTQGNTQV